MWELYADDRLAPRRVVSSIVGLRNMIGHASYLICRVQFRPVQYDIKRTRSCCGRTEPIILLERLGESVVDCDGIA
jgi:hypothetical protein